MPSFKIAHLRQQGQDMIIVPLDPNFDSMSNGDQQDIIADLQAHARGAGWLVKLSLYGRAAVGWPLPLRDHGIPSFGACRCFSSCRMSTKNYRGSSWSSCAELFFFDLRHFRCEFVQWGADAKRHRPCPQRCRDERNRRKATHLSKD